MSDSICQEELRAVQNSDGTRFKEITVRARTSAREVMAVYTLEHMSIELTIKLAGNHPLSPPTIDVGQRVGVGITQWRTWLLQLTAFLTHQVSRKYPNSLIHTDPSCPVEWHSFGWSDSLE